jgi:hypothetical protein
MPRQATSAVFCLTCGWTGRRTQNNTDPCCRPTCRAHTLVRVGDQAPLPVSVRLLVESLLQHPSYLWQLGRELADAPRLVGPWTPVAPSYLERVTMEGQRLASLQVDARLHGWTWETPWGRGAHPDPLQAAREAEATLTIEQGLLLVPSVPKLT